MRATLSRATPSISLVAPSKLTPARCSSRKLLEATFSPSYLPSRGTSTSSALHPVRVAQAQRPFPDMPAENFAGWDCTQGEGRAAEQNAGAQEEAQCQGGRCACGRAARNTFIELAL